MTDNLYNFFIFYFPILKFKDFSQFYFCMFSTFPSLFLPWSLLLFFFSVELLDGTSWRFIWAPFSVHLPQVSQHINDLELSSMPVNFPLLEFFQHSGKCGKVEKIVKGGEIKNIHLCIYACFLHTQIYVEITLLNWDFLSTETYYSFMLLAVLILKKVCILAMFLNSLPVMFLDCGCFLLYEDFH